MGKQVQKLYELGILDASFIGLDSTPVAASTAQNNPKSFLKNKFSKDNQPRNDPDCALGVHTASNQHNEKNFEFYWGYKNHVLVDCISGLPIWELTTPANVPDSAVTERILAEANQLIPVSECTFIADKAYDVMAIYNLVRDVYGKVEIFTTALYRIAVEKSIPKIQCFRTKIVLCGHMKSTTSCNTL